MYLDWCHIWYIVIYPRSVFLGSLPIIDAKHTVLCKDGLRTRYGHQSSSYCHRDCLSAGCHSYPAVVQKSQSVNEDRRRGIPRVGKRATVGASTENTSVRRLSSEAGEMG